MMVFLLVLLGGLVEKVYCGSTDFCLLDEII